MACMICPRLKAYEDGEIDKADNGIQMTLAHSVCTYDIYSTEYRNGM